MEKIPLTFDPSFKSNLFNLFFAISKTELMTCIDSSKSAPFLFVNIILLFRLRSFYMYLKGIFSLIDSCIVFAVSYINCVVLKERSGAGRGSSQVVPFFFLVEINSYAHET